MYLVFGEQLFFRAKIVPKLYFTIQPYKDNRVFAIFPKTVALRHEQKSYFNYYGWLGTGPI